MSRNRIGEIEFCCWPGCPADRYEEPDAPPFCGKHLVRCAAYVTASMKDLLDPFREARPAVARTFTPQVDPKAPIVYYVRLGNHVKIGTTTNLRNRLASLYVDHDPEALLATEPGGRDVEMTRHREFAAERIYANRELFNPSPRLLEHIEQLKTAAPDSTFSRDHHLGRRASVRVAAKPRHGPRHHRTGRGPCSEEST